MLGKISGSQKVSVQKKKESPKRGLGSQKHSLREILPRGPKQNFVAAEKEIRSETAWGPQNSTKAVPLSPAYYSSSISKKKDTVPATKNKGPSSRVSTSKANSSLNKIDRSSGVGNMLTQTGFSTAGKKAFRTNTGKKTKKQKNTAANNSLSRCAGPTPNISAKASCQVNQSKIAGGEKTRFAPPKQPTLLPSPLQKALLSGEQVPFSLRVLNTPVSCSQPSNLPDPAA